MVDNFNQPKRLREIVHFTAESPPVVSSAPPSFDESSSSTGDWVVGSGTGGSGASVETAGSGFGASVGVGGRLPPRLGLAKVPARKARIKAKMQNLISEILHGRD